MEFWGVEVKAGEPLKVKPGVDKIIHLSQASLGESKKDKGNDFVPLFLKFDDQKLVIGTLSPENFPQISFDLVFEKEFELSHNWKNGSVYFCGYKTEIPEENAFSDFDSDSEEELDLLPNNAVNGKLEPKVEVKVEPAKPATVKANAAKPESSVKPKVKLVEPTKGDESDDEVESSEDDYESSTEDESDDEKMLGGEDDSDDDEETPKKAEVGKKRLTESATKTPVPAKKAKLVTPQNTDGKKGGGHTATPHPSKQAGKTPANSDKSKAQTPKSAGQVSCKSCSKTFNSDGALQSHTKAKHGGGK